MIQAVHHQQLNHRHHYHHRRRIRHYHYYQTTLDYSDHQSHLLVQLVAEPRCYWILSYYWL